MRFKKKQKKIEYFPLTTTGDHYLLAQHILDVSKGKRLFIWLHVTNSEQRECVINTCREAGLHILPTVKFFVLACAKDTPTADRMRMINLVNPQENDEDARWKGKMFGYSEEQIEWYLNQLKEGRFFANNPGIFLAGNILRECLK